MVSYLVERYAEPWSGWADGGVQNSIFFFQVLATVIFGFKLYDVGFRVNGSRFGDWERLGFRRF